MSRRTPYDTGRRSEPSVWVDTALDIVLSSENPRKAEDEDYGKVDFEDDAGGMLATIWIEKTPIPGADHDKWIVHIQKWGVPLGLHVHREDETGE